MIFEPVTVPAVAAFCHWINRVSPLATSVHVRGKKIARTCDATLGSRWIGVGSHSDPRVEAVKSEAPFTRYNLLSNRLSNRFDNRVNVCIHDTTGSQTGCQTGLTTGCIVYTTGCQIRLTTGLTTGWMFVYTIVSCTRGLRRSSDCLQLVTEL